MRATIIPLFGANTPVMAIPDLAFGGSSDDGVHVVVALIPPVILSIGGEEEGAGSWPERRTLPDKVLCCSGTLAGVAGTFVA